MVKGTSAEQMATEVQNGASAEFGPAAPRALHAMLDQVLGRSFDGTRATWEVLVAEGWVLHAIRVGAEVAAFSLQDGGRIERLSLRGIEPLQRGGCSGRPEVVEGGSLAASRKVVMAPSAASQRARPALVC